MKEETFRYMLQQTKDKTFVFGERNLLESFRLFKVNYRLFSSIKFTKLIKANITKRDKKTPGKLGINLELMKLFAARQMQLV